MRYIDADALYEKLYPLDLVDKRLYTINAKAVADAIANTPTADVVPKSEVEELKKAYLHYEETTGLKQAKAEVARKIFAEIERLIANECLVFKDENGIRGYVDASVHYAIAELKKKYMEEQNDT